MAKVVERRGFEVEGLGSNLGGMIFVLLLSTGSTSGTKRPRVIVIFEASDVTRVCPLVFMTIFKGAHPGCVVDQHWVCGMKSFIQPNAELKFFDKIVTV